MELQSPFRDLGPMKLITPVPGGQICVKIVSGNLFVLSQSSSPSLKWILLLNLGPGQHHPSSIQQAKGICSDQSMNKLFFRFCLLSRRPG